MGVERLILLLDTLELVPEEVLNTLDVYVCPVGANASLNALLLADNLRTEHSWLRIQTHCGGGSFKSQLKRADKSGARFALLLGEDEVANNSVRSEEHTSELQSRPHL